MIFKVTMLPPMVKWWAMIKQADRIDKLETVVYGNGSIGMDEMLRQVYDWMLDEKQRTLAAAQGKLDDRKYFRRAVIAPSIAAIVMLFANGIVFIFVWFYKLLPVLNELSRTR